MSQESKKSLATEQEAHERYKEAQRDAFDIVSYDYFLE